MTREVPMRALVTTTALALCTAGLAPLAVAHADTSTSVVAGRETTTPIQHLVVIFQENASFDHYFGTYPEAANPPGDPPFIPRADTPAVNNLLPSSLNGNRDLRVTNPNAALPFRLDRSQFVTCSQDHTYRPEQRAANLGRMDRFVQQTDKSGCLLPRPVSSPQVMGYFDGNTVTTLWNYAQHYALNDMAFATTYGPSTPGALNLVAGRTSGASPEAPRNVTEGTVFGDPDPAYDDCADAAVKAQLTGRNIGDLLSDAGISWGWFQGGFRRTNSLDEPEAVCDGSHPNLGRFQDPTPDYEAHHDPFQYFASTANPHHLPPSSPDAIGHDDQARHQYDLTDFWTAAYAGHLPAVSYLKAPGYQDGHPGWSNSNPLDEQDFLVATLNRLQRLPEWEDAAVVLAWDDSDGQYDHQFPPTLHHSHNVAQDTLYGVGNANDPSALMCMAPPGGPAPPPETVFEMRCGYGERLPLLVISPFARANHVDHTIVDQTSVLRFIEDNWGLPRLGDGSFDIGYGVGESADPGPGTLLNMFDFTERRDDVLLLNHLTGNVNRPPEVSDPALTPKAPRTDDTVSVQAEVRDGDEDPTNGRHDVVKTSYAWFDGDIRLDEEGPTLDLSEPGHGDRGDTITVRVTAYNGLDTTVKTSQVVIADSAPAVTLSTAEAEGVYSDDLGPVTVTTSDPDGDPVTVEGTGLPDGGGVAPAADGTHQIGGVVTGRTGRYAATVDVSDGSLSTTAALRITVHPEAATLGYTGDLMSTAGSNAPVHLRAHVTQEDDGTPGDLSRAEVLFDLYGPGNDGAEPDATYRATADAHGDARVEVDALANGTWRVVTRTDPDRGDFSAPSSPAVPLTVSLPDPGGLVVGAGQVPDPDAIGRGPFALAARTRADGTPAGTTSYAFGRPDGTQVLIRSTTWDGGGLSVTAGHATLAGQGDVTVTDGRGRVVARVADARFRVDVADGAAQPGPDGYALSVYTAAGRTFHQVGSATEPLRLARGQVAVRP